MYIYFDKERKLNTILPHGEVPRQGQSLNIYVLLDNDYDTENSKFSLRYKMPTKNFFEADILSKEIKEEKFEAYPNENISNLKNGETYKIIHFDLSDTHITDFAGNVQIVISQMILDSENQAIESTKVFGKVIFYIEETYGLTPDQGLGMTLTEYQSLINYINDIATSVEIGNVEALPSNESPYVKNTGTNKNMVLSFGIPTGKDGASIENLIENGENSDSIPSNKLQVKGIFLLPTNEEELSNVEMTIDLDEENKKANISIVNC